MITINKKKLCENCFGETRQTPCPYCGYKKGKSERDAGALEIGSELDRRYKIGAVLGNGGFGITYLAYDTKLEKRIAIKEYYPKGIASRSNGRVTVSTVNSEAQKAFSDGASRFYKEAEMVSQFNGNPNIVNVYDFFRENETVYFTMAYLRGETLESYMERKGHITEGQAVSVLNSVTSALLITHSVRVLHRDISPDNIRLCDDGTIKLLDFGAARQVFYEESQTFSVIVKPGYAPMEQYQKKGNQGAWTDIYALGVTIYTALTGDKMDDPISRGEDDSSFLSNSHGISEGLWNIIKKCTMLNIEDRYQEIPELKKDLAALGIREEPFGDILVSDVKNGSETDGNATELITNDSASRLTTVLDPIAADGSEDTHDPEQTEEHEGPDSVNNTAPVDDTLRDPRKLIIVMAVVLAALVATAGILIWKRAANEVRSTAGMTSEEETEATEVSEEKPEATEEETEASEEETEAAEEETEASEEETEATEEKAEASEEETEAPGEEDFKEGQEHYDNREYEEAMKCFTKAAAQGNISAQNYIGFMYQYGYGVEQDYEEGVKWYRMAADQGDEVAQTNLAYCYAHGLGVEQDYKEAITWYRKAAEQGQSTAQNNLGDIYFNGKGVEQDYEEAFKWFEKSAAQGYDIAQNYIGYMYEHGYGVEQSDEKAVEWYTKAANNGNASAQYTLGVLYYNGQAVSQNKYEGEMWLKKSAEQGNEDAKAALEKIK